MRSYVHEKTCTRMFTAALFIISLRVSPRLRERSTGVHRAQVFGTSGPGFPGKLSWGPTVSIVVEGLGLRITELPDA